MRTQVHASELLKPATIRKLLFIADFLDGSNWNLTNGANNATITGLADGVDDNDAVNMGQFKAALDSTLKPPDDFDVAASGGQYPTIYKGNPIEEGDTFYCTSAGDAGGITLNIGDLLVAKTDAPGQNDANWFAMESNRDQATESVLGMAKIATQALTDAGANDTDFVTPLKLSTYLANTGIQEITAGDGLYFPSAGEIAIQAADASINVGADDIGVQLGNTLGDSLTITSGGVELAASISGARSFINGVFSVSSGAGNAVSIQAGTTGAVQSDQNMTIRSLSNDVIIQANLLANINAPANGARLINAPDGAEALAISTTGYVDDAITAITYTKITDVFIADATTVTNGYVDTSQAPVTTEHIFVFLDGILMEEGAGNDYTISGQRVTFIDPLYLDAKISVVYKYSA